jgi:hypothetical protein
MKAKYSQMKAGAPNPFIDPAGLQRYVTERRGRVSEGWEKQKQGSRNHLLARIELKRQTVAQRNRDTEPNGTSSNDSGAGGVAAEGALGQSCNDHSTGDVDRWTCGLSFQRVSRRWPPLREQQVASLVPHSLWRSYFSDPVPFDSCHRPSTEKRQQHVPGIPPMNA